jgi:hypothetical protein
MQNQPDDPLAFDPVPRRERVDGWTAERQRVFIKTLAITGSPRRAAALMGKSTNGVDNLRRAPGSESFCAAWDRAMAMAQQVGRDRLEKGLDQARREDAAWTLKPAPWTGPRRAAPQPQAPGDDDDDDDAKRELLESILHKYMLKLEREREARLEGRIAEADFLIRQVTALEVALDVVSGNAIEQLHAAHTNGHLLIDVAETPITRLLDEARRAHWGACGDPPRPDRPAPWLKEDEDGYATEPTESYAGGTDQTIDEQQEAFLRRYAEAAREQVEWEAEARAAAQAQDAVAERPSGLDKD